MNRDGGRGRRPDNPRIDDANVSGAGDHRRRARALDEHVRLADIAPLSQVYEHARDSLLGRV